MVAYQIQISNKTGPLRQFVNICRNPFSSAYLLQQDVHYHFRTGRVHVAVIADEYNSEV